MHAAIWARKGISIGEEGKEEDEDDEKKNSLAYFVGVVVFIFAAT